MFKINKFTICFFAFTAMFFLSCGDPFFLSYQIRKSEQSAPPPEGSKTVNGVTVAAVSDGYRMMYSEYSGFLIYVWNNSGKPVRLETSKVTLKYSGQTIKSIRPKKQFEPMLIEPGEFCDMKVSFELPYEAVNVRGITYIIEVEIPVTFPKNESGKSSEVFSFSSHFESR